MVARDYLLHTYSFGKKKKLYFIPGKNVWVWMMKRVISRKKKITREYSQKRDFLFVLSAARTSKSPGVGDFLK